MRFTAGAYKIAQTVSQGHLSSGVRIHRTAFLADTSERCPYAQDAERPPQKKAPSPEGDGALAI